MGAHHVLKPHDSTNSNNNITNKKNDKFRPQDANFTLAELKAVIPPHCFERSLLRSLFHVIIDLSVICTLGYVGQLFEHSQFSSKYLLADIIIWNVIWFVQGLFWAGIWVLAHECGHGSFSKYQRVNHVIGFILHSLVLIPYFSWRTTHRKHHSSTQHFRRDQVYLPTVPSSKEALKEAMSESPIVSFYRLMIALLLGWPLYLGMNAWGQKFPGKRANHFEPSSPLFAPSQRWEIIASNIGLLVVIACNIYFAYVTSLMTMMKIFGFPYIWVNMWMIIITFLHHTHERVPFFRDSTHWNFVRGALCTIDRDYGILNTIFHHITDTHVVHHLFSSIPFYHAQEATLHVRKLLGTFYLFDDTPFYIALWRTWRRCMFAMDTNEMMYYITE